MVKLNMKKKTGRFDMNSLAKARGCCSGFSESGGQFLIGDRVHLNSGSPILTVVDLINNITVSWVQNGIILEAVFHPDLLHRAKCDGNI